MADNKTAKDGSGSSFTMAFKDIASVFYKKVIMVKSDGTEVDPVTQYAHGVADQGEPVKFGAKAVNSILDQTPVDDDDRTNVFAGVDGVLITRPHVNLESIITERDSITSGTSTAFGSAFAATASQYIYVTSVAIANTSTTDTYVDLQAGASGTVLWTLPCPAKGGAIQTFDPPLRLPVNTALAYQVGTGSTTVYISANGFKSKI